MSSVKLSKARAQTHLGKYTQKAVNGETFIIANRNRPLARLMPIEDCETSARSQWISTPHYQILKSATTENEDDPVRYPHLPSAFMLGKLPMIHRAPFDRLLIATCIVNGWTLATQDGQIP